jgi:hypothetical protein
MKCLIWSEIDSVIPKEILNQSGEDRFFLVKEADKISSLLETLNPEMLLITIDSSSQSSQSSQAGTMGTLDDVAQRVSQWKAQAPHVRTFYLVEKKEGEHFQEWEKSPLKGDGFFPRPFDPDFVLKIGHNILKYLQH